MYRCACSRAWLIRMFASAVIPATAHATWSSIMYLVRASVAEGGEAEEGGAGGEGGVEGLLELRGEGV